MRSTWIGQNCTEVWLMINDDNKKPPNCHLSFELPHCPHFERPHFRKKPNFSLINSCECVKNCELNCLWSIGSVQARPTVTLPQHLVRSRIPRTTPLWCRKQHKGKIVPQGLEGPRAPESSFTTDQLAEKEKMNVTCQSWVICKWSGTAAHRKKT